MASNSFKTAVPSIKELYLHVIKKVAHKWESLALCLDLEEKGSRIESIRRSYINHGVDICCMQALHCWLKGEGKHPVNWETMLECLNDIDCFAIAEQVEEALRGKDVKNNVKNGNYILYVCMYV